MEKRSGTVFYWIISSVVVAVLPVFFAILFSGIVNKWSEISEILVDFILVSFSIACSSCSLCFNALIQKKCKKMKVCFGISISIAIASWSLYLLSILANFSIGWQLILIIFMLFMTIVSCHLGILSGKESEKIENDLICEMHNNCKKIRKKLLIADEKKKLEEALENSENFLCDPKVFYHVGQKMNDILESRKKGKEGNE